MIDEVKQNCKVSGNYFGKAHQSCFEYVNIDDQHKIIPIL